MINELSNYDRWIWRVNGSLLLIACLLGVFGLLFAGIQLIRGTSNERSSADLVEVDAKLNIENQLQLGSFQPLEGTDLLLAPLAADSKEGIGSYSKYVDSGTRNHLVFNSKSKSTYWIFPSNAFSVLGTTTIFNQPKAPNRVARGLMIQKISDSQVGKKTASSNLVTVEFHDLASRITHPAVSNIDRVIGVEQTSAAEVAIFYSRLNKSYFRIFEIESKSIGAEIEIGVPQAASRPEL